MSVPGALRLHTFRRADLALLPADLRRGEVLKREGMPFVLSHDGRPHIVINAFLETLPVSGAPARKTWLAYARDLVEWTRWLRERGADLCDDPAWLRDLVDDYQSDLLGGELDIRKAPASWNRAAQALVRFYVWAVDMGHVSAMPFTFTSIRVRRPGLGTKVVGRNNAKVRDAKSHAKIHWLDTDYLGLFTDVGMGGLRPGGAADLAFHGRNGARNRALAAFLAASGLRAAEFSNLLIWELPRLPMLGTRPFVALPLPGSICKGGRPRTTWVTPAALQLVHEYVALERDLAAEGAAWLPSSGEALRVSDPSPAGGRINGRSVRWERLTIDERQRLVAPGGGAAMVFVSSIGRPVCQWKKVFDEASRRCQLVDPAFPNVTPHVLRHTFAVHTLKLLVGRQLADLLAVNKEEFDPAWLAALRTSNPLLVVRDLLGHTSVGTTEIYLKLIDTARLFTEEADLPEHAWAGAK